jgi:signal transduction histidine kinase
MKDSQGSVSLLYRRLRTFRYVLPIIAFLLVVVHQFLAHTWFRSLPWFQHFLWQVLLYGTVGPILIWFVLTWLVRWVRGRDEVEAYLRSLYQVSRQAATATDMEALVEIALRMPEQVLSPVATSLILREHPEGTWTLAGTRHVPGEALETLEAQVAAAGANLACGQCSGLAATVRQDCPLRSCLSQPDLRPTDTSIICLPLSTERPPLALLNVYLFKGDELLPAKRQVLEAMTAGLAVALDHARLRRREFQMLDRMEQAVRRQEAMTATLPRILAEMATAHRAEAGEVFLVSREGEERALISVAAWPGEKACPHLATPAYQSLQAGDSVITTNGSLRGEHKVAIPLIAEGLTMGILVLAGRHPFTASQIAFLRAAAGMMALVIRNSQLYAELESQAVLEERNRLACEVHDGLAQSLGFLNFKMQQVDRLLAREQWEAARRALREMREGVQDLYTEVRLTIQDLRWPSSEGGLGLDERLRQYVTAFAARTNLDVSLDVDGEPRLSPQEEVHLFRIVQEAMANVRKHAQAQHVWVRLRTGPEGTTLEVEDDGAGLSPAAYPQDSVRSESLWDLPDVAGHFGLRIMQERAEAMGGRLSLRSAPGQGTRLQVTVAPLPLGASDQDR